MNHLRALPAAIGQSLPPRDQRGLGLLGLIVTLALSAVVVGVGFTVYIQGDRARQVSLETGNAQAISMAIRNSYASSPNYIALTQTSALRDKLFPGGLLTGGTVQSTWGAPVVVSSMGAGAGYLIEYDNVPATTCARFAASGGQGFADVNVNGQSVVTSKVVQMASAIALCSGTSSNTIQFINYRLGATASGNPALTPCVVQPDQTQMVACPAGQQSSIAPYSVNGVTQGQSSSCPTPYGPVAWSPWTPIASSCVPSCATLLPTAPWLPNPGTQTQTVPGSALCPFGQTGSDTWTQQQTQSRTATCAGPTPVSDPTWGAWSPWANTGGKIGEVNTCAPTCATRLGTAPWTPNPATQTQTVPGSAACPSGVGSDTWTQQQTRSRTATCATPGSAVDPVWGAWSPWANTGGKIGEVKTCAPPCGPAPAPGSQTLACPPPQTGAITQTHGWTSAAAPTCWTASPWTTTSNTCVTPPPAHPPTSICEVDWDTGAAQVVYITATKHVVVTNVAGWPGATAAGVCSNAVLIDWSGGYQGINNLVQSSSSPDNQMATFPTYPDPAYPSGP